MNIREQYSGQRVESNHAVKLDTEGISLSVIRAMHDQFKQPVQCPPCATVRTPWSLTAKNLVSAPLETLSHVTLEKLPSLLNVQFLV